MFRNIISLIPNNMYLKNTSKADFSNQKHFAFRSTSKVIQFQLVKDFPFYAKSTIDKNLENREKIFGKTK